MAIAVRSDRLSAAFLVDAIARTFVPSARPYAASFRARGNAIDVREAVLPAARARQIRPGTRHEALWHHYLQAAASMDEWMVVSGIARTTTSQQGSQVKSLVIDLPAGMRILNGRGERYDSAAPEIQSLNAFADSTGRTIPSASRVASLHAGGIAYTGNRVEGNIGVLVVTDRLEQRHGMQGQRPGRITSRDPAQIIETFLHEAAAHAGRASANEPFHENDAVVAFLIEQTERLLPPRVSNLPSTPRARVP